MTISPLALSSAFSLVIFARVCTSRSENQLRVLSCLPPNSETIKLPSLNYVYKSQKKTFYPVGKTSIGLQLKWFSTWIWDLEDRKSSPWIRWCSLYISSTYVTSCYSDYSRSDEPKEKQEWLKRKLSLGSPFKTSNNLRKRVFYFLACLWKETN